MALTTDQTQQLALSLLNDKEYRHIYADEGINTGLAFQIREMRAAARWSQPTMGRMMPGKPVAQGTISDWENPDYGKYSLTTLKRIAEAFDVGLIVRFVPFSELVDWAAYLTPARISPVSADNDQRLKTQAGVRTEPQLALFGDTSTVLAFRFPVVAESVHSLPAESTRIFQVAATS